MKDCKECLNSRLIVSENGYNAICTLNSKQSYECLSSNKCNFIWRKTEKKVEGVSK